MAEVKGEKERAIYKSTLEEIVERINENLKSKHIQNEIVVKEGRSIGILTFNKNQEAKSKKLYAITMVIDGKQFDYIYDETGDNIARVGANNEVFTDDDIQLDKDRLIENMNLSKGFQNDNQGRHIADRSERIILSEDEKKQQFMDYEDRIELPNLVDREVVLDSSAAIIDLYRTIYNGRRLRDMLGIDQKLKDRLPNGANIEHLNFLTVINSDQLTAKDMKRRESDTTCVIMDDPRNPKYMIELDTSILKPREDLSKQENITADQTSEHLGDGEIKKGTSTTTNTRQISTFEIPDAGASISQPNDLITLEIRQNPNYIDESKSQKNNAHNIEFYIGIQDKSKTENEQKHGLNTKSIKLEAYDETNRIEEFEMQQAFRTDYGVDDELVNLKTVNGMGRNQERDANELNKQMKLEGEKHKETIDKQSENKSNINTEVASQVNERQIAWDIIKESDEYGPRDIKYIYNLIMEKKAVMESHNETINNDVLKKRVQQDLENQRTLGDMSNPRRVG